MLQTVDDGLIKLLIEQSFERQSTIEETRLWEIEKRKVASWKAADKRMAIKAKRQYLITQKGRYLPLLIPDHSALFAITVAAARVVRT